MVRWHAFRSAARRIEPVYAHIDKGPQVGIGVAKARMVPDALVQLDDMDALMSLPVHRFTYC